MPIAQCDVLHDIFIPADFPVMVDGSEFTGWLLKGAHAIDADFARLREADGYLVVNEIDGTTAYRMACCADC